MKEHLKKCFITGNISPFPERINRRKCAIKVASQETVPIYCLCRLPYGGENMVLCEACHQWYHPDCAQIPKKIPIKEMQIRLFLQRLHSVRPHHFIIINTLSYLLYILHFVLYFLSTIILLTLHYCFAAIYAGVTASL